MACPSQAKKPPPAGVGAGVGEALVSLLDTKGRPCPTERVYVLPPASQIGPITAAQRQSLLAESIVAALDKAPKGALVFHVDGAFHSDYGLGTSSRVKRRKIG